MKQPSAPHPVHTENRPQAPIILGAAILAAGTYAALAAMGDLRERLGVYLAAHGLLLACMALGWWVLRRQEGSPTTSLRVVLGAALMFRLIAAVGAPALSDDVYRYVWDGRVQLQGVHPYAYAPTDPALEDLRDEDWSRINHPQLKTIYPPLAQVWFLLLAGLGAGTTGFKLAIGLVDFAVVLALGRLLQRLGQPQHLLVLYAWNPLAVLESAGSGHIEPLGALPVLLATLWILERRSRRAPLALAAAVHVKLLPMLLIPGFLRRLRPAEVALLGAVLIGLLLPYALTGPAIGGGTADYAERWEHNASLYAGVRAGLEWADPTPLLKRGIARLQARVGEGRVDWDLLYRHVWPRDLAKLILVTGLAIFILYLALGKDRGPAREAFLVLAGAIVISPTVHPWYLLWVLPFAAALRSGPWMLFAALIPLSYLSGDGDVSGTLRALQYLPPLILAAGLGFGRRLAAGPEGGGSTPGNLGA